MAIILSRFRKLEKSILFMLGHKNYLWPLKIIMTQKKKLSTFISTSFTRKVDVLNFLDYLKKQYLPFQYVKRFY